jgi:hypothetical protein
MWGILWIIVNGYDNNKTTNTDFITGFTSKNYADAAAAQIKEDMKLTYFQVYTSVICVAGCS